MDPTEALRKAHGLRIENATDTAPSMFFFYLTVPELQNVSLYSSAFQNHSGFCVCRNVFIFDRDEDPN